MRRLTHICRTRKNKYRKGFTLVETVIVATIFSFVALGIATSFVSGMKLWSRATEGGFAKQEILFNLEKITKDLRQIVNIGSIGFDGTGEEFSFASVENDSVVKITYKFIPAEKILVRKSIALKDVLDGKEKEESAGLERKFLPLETFSLQYFCFDSEADTYVWRDACVKDKDIFVAVRLEGKFQENDFKKTVFIPIFS